MMDWNSRTWGGRGAADQGRLLGGGRRRRSTAARRRGRAGEALEPRRLLATDLIVSEFLATNTANLADQDGEFSDWIEIQNTTGSPIDLAGWSLTDDPANLAKWQFPSQVVPAGGYLVVFASGKDRAVSGQQ
jgi:hypothetical protein